MEKKRATKRENKIERLFYIFKKHKGGRAGKGPIREQNCIRCGWCLEVCPIRLMPTMLVRYAKAGLYDYCQKYYIDYCSGCGACAYVCPAKIPLLRYINIAKRELTKKAAKNNVRGVAIHLKKE